MHITLQIKLLQNILTMIRLSPAEMLKRQQLGKITALVSDYDMIFHPTFKAVRAHITVSPLTVMAEVDVSPQDGVANPQGMKMFAVDRYELPEDFVYFRILCGTSMHLSPLVFAPKSCVRE